MKAKIESMPKWQLALGVALVLTGVVGLLTLALGLFAGDSETMADVIRQSTTLKLATAGLGLVTVWLVLRFLDWLSQFKFREWLHAAAQDDPYLAVYLGLRFLGACILIGLLLS